MSEEFFIGVLGCFAHELLLLRLYFGFLYNDVLNGVIVAELFFLLLRLLLHLLL
jgi:hypothetical protein